MFLSRRVPILLVISFSFLLVANAQVQPFNSYAGGPDLINLASLNTHWSIPVIHKPGRGTDFTYDLSYDSAVWRPIISGSTTTWQPAQNFGWRGVTEISFGYVGFNSYTWTCIEPDTGNKLSVTTWGYMGIS